MTYSQLDLGENYHSYNNRQSQPNIRQALADSANQQQLSETDERWTGGTRRRRGRSFSATKSAPVKNDPTYQLPRTVLTNTYDWNVIGNICRGLS